MRCSMLRCVLTLALVAAALGRAALADGLIRDGIGPISTGRGGTNLGFADNGAIIHDNPAAMINASGLGLLELGVDTAICHLQYSDPLNPDVDGIVRGWPTGMVSYVRRVPDSPWAYGFGVFAPAGFGAEYNMFHPAFGPVKYESLGMLVKLLPALAWQVNDRLSIGGSLGLALGHNELEGPYHIQTGPLAGTPTLLDLQATGAAITGGVGLQYLLTPTTTLGIAYTEQTYFDMDGRARVTLPGGALQSDFDAQLRLVWPRSLGIGLKHELCCCQRIGCDVIWYNWSDAFDRLDLTLADPSHPIFEALLGPEFRDTFPLGWRDTVSFRFGYERDASECLTWRLGYVYHDSPVPSATLNPYLDGVLLHTFSAGLSYQFRCGAWFNAAYQYSFSPTREVGQSEIIGGDFDNSTFLAEAHWINLSVLFRY